MKVNDSLLLLIKNFEGFRPIIYKCSAEKDTIGYGHVVSEEEKIKYKNGISELDATSLLINDIEKVFIGLSKLIKTTKDGVLTQNQIEALISLIFNIGIGRFSKSLAFKYIKESEKFSKNIGGKREFLKEKAKKELFDPIIGFVKVKNVISKGLVKRRAAELELWNKE